MDTLPWFDASFPGTLETSSHLPFSPSSVVKKARSLSSAIRCRFTGYHISLGGLLLELQVEDAKWRQREAQGERMVMEWNVLGFDFTTISDVTASKK